MLGLEFIKQSTQPQQQYIKKANIMQASLLNNNKNAFKLFIQKLHPKKTCSNVLTAKRSLPQLIQKGTRRRVWTNTCITSERTITNRKIDLYAKIREIHDVTNDDDGSKNSGRKRETKIQVIGNTKEYDAVKQLRFIELPDENNPQPNLIASMHVKRNIIFGTRIHDREYLQSKKKMVKNGEKAKKSDCGDDDDNDEQNYHNLGFVKVCKPLLKKCLEHASVEGDQPQGLAALNGLSARVRYLLDNPTQSKVIGILRQGGDARNDDNKNKIIFEAITSIATQVPRDGNDTVGIGTYFDAREGWTQLAKEYAMSKEGTMIVQGEAQLFQSYGAVLVGIEYVGEENPSYWIDSGGAMARFIFV